MREMMLGIPLRSGDACSLYTFLPEQLLPGAWFECLLPRAFGEALDVRDSSLTSFKHLPVFRGYPCN